MWICTNSAFLSVVHKDCKPDELLVRARMKGHIESVFPDAKVTESTHTDYRYRAILPREIVADVISAQLMYLSYSNFKNSVNNRRLHDAYGAFWGIHAKLQPSAPYSGGRFPGRGLVP